MAFLTSVKAKVVAPPLVPREQVTIVFPQNVMKKKNENENKDQYKTKKAPPSGRGLIFYSNVLKYTKLIIS